MKLNTPREVATFIAILIGAIVILVYSIVGFLVGQFNFIILACVGILSIVLSYILIFYSLEYFINKKIRLIYRTIRKHKLGPKSTKEFKMNEDILENVNKEVIDWAESSATQIAQLRKQETFRREYIGNLSHELKTPIFSIQGYILTLLEGGLEDESINRKFLERASKGVDRITKIVDDLDTITKLEEGRLNLETKKQDLVELAREVMESFEIKAGKRKIEVSFDQEYNKEIFVDMNRSGIGQVFTNLINNSLNYGKEEGRTEIRFHDMETQILIEVSDDGIGIAEDQLPRLFERFYRVDKSRTRNEGGTGLGLAIVKHIVDSHGQSINVRSTLGEGSTFSFTLKKA